MVTPAPQSVLLPVYIPPTEEEVTIGGNEPPAKLWSPKFPCVPELAPVKVKILQDEKKAKNESVNKITVYFIKTPSP